MAEIPFAVFNVLAQFPESELVLFETVWEALPFEIGLNAGDDGVGTSEDGDGDARTVGGA